MEKNVFLLVAYLRPFVNDVVEKGTEIWFLCFCCNEL